MTVWILRDGRLVNKAEYLNKGQVTVDFPIPHVSRFEPFDSPVTGQTISSWRQRDADMQAADAVDPRDLSGVPFEKRRGKNAQRPDDTFQWGEPSD